MKYTTQKSYVGKQVRVTTCTGLTDTGVLTTNSWHEIADITSTTVDPVDMVNHPTHYQSNKGIEVIDVVEAFTDGLSGIEATDTGNILKYMCRWKNKNGIEDLKKAQWYLNHLINRLTEKNTKQ